MELSAVVFLPYPNTGRSGAAVKESRDPMLTRRRFLATTACTVAAARLRVHGQSKIRVALSIPNDATGPRMPIDFVGLSYEVQQLADPSFFSAQNSDLIREFKALSLTGVLRLGGNTSEFAYWKPKPDSPEPEHPPVREVAGEPKARYYAVTPEAVGLVRRRDRAGEPRVFRTRMQDRRGSRRRRAAPPGT